MPSFAKSVLIAVVTGAFAGLPALGNPAPPREVNITSDSERGWIPSAELEERAKATVERFWGATTSGQTDEAYALFGPELTQHLTKAQFRKDLASTQGKTGRPIEVRFVKTTWTKDSPRAPEPGVYVAVDVEAKFERALRYCGYIVLHQSRPNEDFRVSRHQQVFIDDASARAIEAKQSRGALDGIWAQLIEGCPNYRGVFAGMPEIEESSGGSIGYPSVAAALTDLRNRRDVAFRTERGWTIAEDSSAMTIWSFAPEGHAAFPSAVKRWVTSEKGRTSLNMAVACESSKAACDALVREFQRLNAAALR